MELTPAQIDRFWNNVSKKGDCWEWTAGKFTHGYGAMHVGPKVLLTHRISYEMLHGESIEDKIIDHICHNPPCVNPDHLRVVTRAQNSQNYSPTPRANNKSGFRGVSLDKKSGRWVASTRHAGKMHVSFHDTKEEAAEAARMKRLELHTHNDLDRREAA